MERRNKTSFSVKDKDGKELKLAVLRPNLKQQKQAQIHYNALFAELVTQAKPAVLREALDDVARKQGLWSDEKQEEYNKYLDEFNEAERALDSGGIRLSEAKKLALRMKWLRAKMSSMRSWRTRLDALTAQGQADNHSFNYLVSECTVYDETGQRFFKSLDDYLSRDEDDASAEAAGKLAELMYELDSNFQQKYAENKFLIQYKMMDSELRLIDKDGNLIDEDGKRVNEKGQWVDSDGNLIDEGGHKLNDKGEYVVASKPFLDDDGHEIVTG